MSRPGFSLTTVDSDGDVGTHTSVTVGADGLGLISYYDNTNVDLKVAHCSDARLHAPPPSPRSTAAGLVG